jgi:hypothetical protein
MTTHSLPRYVRAPGILLTLFLLACGRRIAEPVTAVAPDHAKIDLHTRVMTEADPKVRAACEAGVTSALRYHGFILDPAGVRVEVDVTVLRDFGLGTATFADAPVQGVTGTPPTTQPARDPEQTADLNARVYVSGRPPRVLHTGGSAPRAACGFAAERFATALVEALGAAPPVAAPSPAPPPAGSNAPNAAAVVQ